MVKVRVVPRQRYHHRKGDGGWRHHYVDYRLLIEFPADFAREILDFAGVEVVLEWRGNEVAIRPKNPESLRRGTAQPASKPVQEFLKTFRHAQKP